MSIICGLSHSQHFVTDNPAWAWDQAPQHSHNWHKTPFPDSSVVHLQRGCIQTAHRPQSCHTQVYLSYLWRLKSDNTAVLATPLHSLLVTTCSPPHCLIHKHMQSSTLPDTQVQQHSDTLLQWLWQHAVIHTAWYTSTATQWHTASVIVTTCSHPHCLIHKYSNTVTHCFSDCDNMQSSTLTDIQTCIATHAVNSYPYCLMYNYRHTLLACE